MRELVFQPESIKPPVFSTKTGVLDFVSIRQHRIAVMADCLEDMIIDGYAVRSHSMPDGLPGYTIQIVGPINKKEEKHLAALFKGRRLDIQPKTIDIRSHSIGDEPPRLQAPLIANPDWLFWRHKAIVQILRSRGLID